jgi:putative transposase
MASRALPDDAMNSQRRRGRPRVPLTLSSPERAELESFARSRALPAGLVRRARLWTATADAILELAEV